MKKQLIQTLFICSIVVSNIIAGKIISIFGLIVPGAVLCYAISFLGTDLLSELYGKKVAQRTVLLGFIATLFASLMIYLTLFLPAAPFATEQSKAYEVLLGLNFRFVLASMAAYLLSQTFDVWIFHKIRNSTKGKHRWLRNNLSTSLSQLLDTSIFISIAFYGIVPDLLHMIFSQYIIKLGIAALDTIPFYLLTRSSSKDL